MSETFVWTINMLIVFVWGLVIGSFTVCWAYRRNNGISIVKVAHSYCESCKAKLNFFDLVPVLNYFWNGGKCRKCKNPYSPLSTFVELWLGVVFVVAVVFAKSVLQAGFIVAPIWILTFIILNNYFSGQRLYLEAKKKREENK